jgi:NADPH:quinone reductase-like Zn-dependent oxidoreductase
MSTMPTNTAAWINTPKMKPLEIKEAPLGNPAENQILVKNHAIALNPIDCKLQNLAIYPLEYPTILGQDVAGEVVAIGPNVTRFKVGDRVTGLTAGFATKQNDEKAFQSYTILRTYLVSEIPQSLSYEDAVVLPLASPNTRYCRDRTHPTPRMLRHPRRRATSMTTLQSW